MNPSAKPQNIASTAITDTEIAPSPVIKESSTHQQKSHWM